MYLVPLTGIVAHPVSKLVSISAGSIRSIDPRLLFGIGFRIGSGLSFLIPALLLKGPEDGRHELKQRNGEG